MNKANGFTIVELMITVVIIAILATVTLVAYSSVQSRARSSTLTASLSDVARRLATYQVDNSDNNPTLLADIGVTNDNGINYQYSVNNSVLPKTYCITATTGDTSYNVSSTSPSNPVSGGCSGHVVGGGGTQITNLSINPGLIINTNSMSVWPGNGGGASTGSRVASGWSLSGYVLRATWTAANSVYNGDAGYTVPNTGAGSLQPNTRYTARWRMATSKSQRLNVAVGNWAIPGGGSGSGTGAYNGQSPAVITTANTPVEQWISFTTGPNTTGLRMFSSLTSGTGASYWAIGDYIEVSEFMLVQGPTKYSYYDGNSAGWTWSGTAGSSQSSGVAP